MPKTKVFISSVQSEFSKERRELHDYIKSDALLGKFFEPFIFELLPASDTTVTQTYLKEVEQSGVYIGLFGKLYGFEDEKGISPTEREFDHATLHRKTRYVFITEHSNSERHPKEVLLINKAQEKLIRKSFRDISELKTAVYTSLVNYLIEKEIVRTAPFDASTDNNASLSDIDTNKIINFIKLSKQKRGFPLSEAASTEDILTHLNLYNDGKLSNAALLLFGREPQRFFINSEIRCAYFLGTELEKPIPSYKVFKGDVFELVNQAEEFVLSKLDYSIGTRSEGASIPGAYEIPREIISEAIVNAVAHRDYTCNGSIQVMLFKDRLEIWNPGNLPLGWTTDKLKKLHRSVPANPLLAEPMYLAGYIERLGTGTMDMVRIAKKAGLSEPEFIDDDEFKTIIFRANLQQAPDKRPTSTQQASGKQVPIEVKKVVEILSGEMKRSELMEILQLKDRENFMSNYLNPSVELKLIEPTYPDNPRHPNQKYFLTEEGKQLKKHLNNNL
ncbi:putative transcriptional regulator [uncultured Paludibacter sp.]|nr:putative transcriptional regulator [uncultured Paludibacter sp.]